MSRVLNLATLLFTIIFSGFLLLYVDWNALTEQVRTSAAARHRCARATCCVASYVPLVPPARALLTRRLRVQCRGHARDCDVAAVGVRSRPLAAVSGVRASAVLLYLIVFATAWLWTAVRFVAEVPALLELRAFCATKLGLADVELRTVTWPELVARVVASQVTTRLCVVRDLSAHDICSRIMRKENYLIGMLNKRVLRLTVPFLPGALGKRVWLTKMVEWNLYWSVLDSLFDEHCRVRPDFSDEAALVRRFRRLAVLNLVMSPFLTVFMVLHFFLRNAERLYHHPSAVGARRWSAVARWHMRELNELPHLLEARLAAAHAPAGAYCAAFPNPVLSMCAKFVAFVVGAFAAALIALAAVDERILEGVLWGRNLLWYTALCGTLLALSRALIVDDDPSKRPPMPDAAMADVVAHTHYLPRRWRNAAHTRAVHDEFASLFPLAVATLVEEVASIFVAPALLWWSLPACASDIIRFVREFTTDAEGVGHVCSLASFDFARHGNSHYGSPFDASRAARSSQGKMEKSFLSFHALYASGWEPDAPGRAMLAAVGAPEAPVAQPTRASAWSGARGGAAHSAADKEEAPPPLERDHQLLQSIYEERAAHRAAATPPHEPPLL